ncbi:ABC transporter permease [Rathayibacter soli]|uniref:ABC transporter permease n=1 Tax=Rathayibacter soli TaxID=3144168 RepID=UPI0027E586F9|nr:ABC transporter permease [Glaciibacter superstes]
MNFFEWFFNPAQWTGSESIPLEVGLHLEYTGIALLIALVVAVPFGIYVGYTGRGEVIVAGLANSLRALPTVGLLILAVLILAPMFASDLAFTIPAIAVLVLLAIPPILTGTYGGIQSADPGAVSAARGMGYTKMQILWHVQLPCALPLMFSGIRGGLLQVVSTATVAAYVGLGGLGRYIIDGQAQGNYSEMLGGAVLIAVLAVVLELGFIGLTRLVVSPGLLRKTRRQPRAARAGRAARAPASALSGTTDTSSTRLGEIHR